MILSPLCSPIKHFPEGNRKQFQPLPAFFGEPNVLGVEIEGEAKGSALVIQFEPANRPVTVDAEIPQKVGFVVDLRLSDEPEVDLVFVLVLEPGKDGFRRQQRRRGPEEVIEDHDPLDLQAKLGQIVVELDTSASRSIAPVVLQDSLPAKTSWPEAIV